MGQTRSISVAMLVVVTAIATLALLSAPSRAQAVSRCAFETSVGRGNQAHLMAATVLVRHVTCTRARTIIHTYLERKVDQQSERCAGRADNPPYRGCIVDGYRCRAAASGTTLRDSFTPQFCTDGPRRIAFGERDRTSN